MARDDKTADKGGKVKVRVIDFEMEGSNQTLRESIRDIVGAIGKSNTTIVRVAGKPALLEDAKKGNGAAEIVSDADDEELEELDADSQVADEEVTETRPRRSYKVKTPKIVQVELRSGDMPLRTFLAKAPDTIDKRYILIAYWYKTYREINQVSQDHIYTAYKEMSWTNFPKDVGQPLRALKKDGWFDKGTGGGAYSLNHMGDGKAVDLLKEMGVLNA